MQEEAVVLRSTASFRARVAYVLTEAVTCSFFFLVMQEVSVLLLSGALVAVAQEAMAAQALVDSVSVSA